MACCKNVRNRSIQLKATLINYIPKHDDYAALKQYFTKNGHFAKL